MSAEELAQQLKAAQERIAELETQCYIVEHRLRVEAKPIIEALNRYRETLDIDGQRALNQAWKDSIYSSAIRLQMFLRNAVTPKPDYLEEE